MLHNPNEEFENVIFMAKVLGFTISNEEHYLWFLKDNNHRLAITYNVEKKHYQCFANGGSPIFEKKEEVEEYILFILGLF